MNLAPDSALRAPPYSSNSSSSTRDFCERLSRPGAAAAVCPTMDKRGVRWRQQLQLLSTEGSSGVLRSIRRAYGVDKKRMVSKPTGDSEDLSVNNPLSSDPNSAWAKWWKTEVRMTHCHVGVFLLSP